MCVGVGGREGGREGGKEGEVLRLGWGVGQTHIRGAPFVHISAARKAGPAVAPRLAKGRQEVYASLLVQSSD